MYDILPPANAPDPFRYNYRPKKHSRPPEKGKWQHKPGGSHFDIVAKRRERELLRETPSTPTAPTPLSGVPIRERDVPYNFSGPRTTSRPAVTRSPGFRSSPRTPIRRRLPGLIILLLGFGMISFGVWNLQAAGRLTQALVTIQQHVSVAVSAMVHQGTALAEANTGASTPGFASAHQEFISAQQEMDAALASNKEILSLLDVTGTVKSGDTLLNVGARLSSAGDHVTKAIAPFIKADQSTSLTDVMSSARPELAAAERDLNSVNDQLDSVSTTMLPRNLADKVTSLKESLPTILNVVHHLNEESGTLLALLGADYDRQYLFLFANNDELRPAGGFIGSTALLNVSRGKIENIDVKSVYDGDGQLKTPFAAPEPLTKIVDRLYLRDSNWFVDFRTDAQKASDLFEKEGGPTVDGVVLFTPEVMKNLLKVTGPIHVPGYDVDVTADNFVTTTQGEVTYNYDKTVNKPKQFLADLAPILLSKVFASSGDSSKPADRLATLEALTNSLAEKDILLYFKNEQAQQEVERLGWAGAIPVEKQGFLMVDNANIGGHKSDQFMSQEIDSRNMVLSNGDVDVVTTIRRTHHGPDEKINYPYPVGEDPSQKDNVIYQRVLVPKDVVLIDAQGFTSESQVPQPLQQAGTNTLPNDPDIASWQEAQHSGVNGTTIGIESGYTYFANWMVTKPGQTTVALYHYRIPHSFVIPTLLSPASKYTVAVVKQPGQQRTGLHITIQFPNNMHIVHQVPDEGVTLDSDSSIVYRGDGTRDILVGAVVQ